MIRSTRNFSLLLLAAALSGCSELIDDTRSSKRQIELPADKTVVAEGAGELSYKAKADGRIYVFDVVDETVIDARRVREGQVFTLSPGSNAATLDGRKATEKDLKRNHEHRLYFEKE